MLPVLHPGLSLERTDQSSRKPHATQASHGSLAAWAHKHDNLPLDPRAQARVIR